jgi:hypothetical protein
MELQQISLGQPAPRATGQQQGWQTHQRWVNDQLAGCLFAPTKAKKIEGIAE